jgi:signal transduction histidine kinase
VLLAAGVLSAALGLFVADRFIQPLSTLGKAAEGVAADGVLTPLPHSSFAEVDRLARLFGTMRQRLQARTEEREGALDAAREAIRVREEFVSVAAHELKTPVTALRGQAQLLLRQLDSFETLRPEQLRNGLSSIDRQSKRMARLIDQLLDVARLERDLLSLDPTDVDMRELVQEVVLTNAQDNRVVLNVCAADCIVRGDRLRLEQVLDNLIENAAKFSPQGGRIDVGVDVTDGAVHITIRDYGLGIPVQHRERIFERFYQAHATSHRSGLGLGLYIVKQIVDLHHGQIRFESPNDGGTLFVIDLPQARSRVAPAARGADC